MLDLLTNWWGKVMAKIKMLANKLENPTVSFISLVERGANRIPFRIVKLDKENGMLDLSSAFRRKVVKEEPSCTLAGVVIPKFEDMEAAEAVLKSNGIEMGDRSELADGTIIFKMGESDDTVVFRLNSRMLALVSDFDDSKVPESIAKAAEDLGYWPGADHGKTDAVQKSDEDLADALVYSGIVKSVIPENVLTAAAALAEFDLAAEEVEEAKPVEVESTEVKKEEPEVVVSLEAPAAPVGEAEEAPVEVAAPAATAADMQELVLKMVSEAIKPLTDLVEKSMSDLSAQVSDIKEQGQTLATKMAEVEKVAKAADESISGLVVGGVPSEDKGKVVKTDSDPRSGQYDTAFLPRRSTVSKFQRR